MATLVSTAVDPHEIEAVTTFLERQLEKAKKIATIKIITEDDFLKLLG